MKQLNIPHPILLLTIGNPGAGKSSLARQLVESLDFALVHANRLRYELFSQPTFAKQEEDVVAHLAEYLLEEMLRTKGNIIFDANAQSRATRQRLIIQAKNAGYKVATVWVQTDLETSFARASKRGNTALSDKYATSLPRDVFERMTAQFTKPLPGEVCVVVSGKHTPAVQLRALSSKLESLYGAQSITVNKKPRPKVKAEPRILEEKGSKDTSSKGRSSAHPEQRSQPRFDIMRRIKIR